MNIYPSYVDSFAIELYESKLLTDTTVNPPKESKEELDKLGVIFDSRLWNEQISLEEVLKILIFDSRMELVWPALTKRASDMQCPDAFYFSLCAEIHEIYAGPMDWDLLTHVEKVQKMEKINKLAMQLAIEVANTPLDLNVMNYADHRFYFDVLKGKLPENSARYIDNALNAFCIFDGNTYKPKTDHVDHAVGTVWSLAGVQAPPLSSLLQDVSTRAKNIECESVIKRKHKVRRSYFIRKLNSFFIRAFDSSLYNINASISSIFLNEEITVDEVRSSLR